MKKPKKWVAEADTRRNSDGSIYYLMWQVFPEGEEDGDKVYSCQYETHAKRLAQILNSYSRRQYRERKEKASAVCDHGTYA